MAPSFFLSHWSGTYKYLTAHAHYRLEDAANLTLLVCSFELKKMARFPVFAKVDI